MKGVPNRTKIILQYLNLDKNDEPMSIWLKSGFSSANISIDSFFKNKKIYFNT